MARGVVVPLTRADRRQRALYLAGEATIDTLDVFVRKAGAAKMCPSLTYRLKVFNGGKDPRAADPSTGILGYRFCDCMGGACWCQGCDRYQPARFSPYKGWMNTDSAMIEARMKSPRCWIRVPTPIAGDVMVCETGSPGHEKCGHVSTIVGYKLDRFDWKDRDCWEAIEAVDVAFRSGRANRRTTGRGWFAPAQITPQPLTMFLRWIGTPDTLERGAKGEIVTWLQRKLVGLKDDGDFGKITEAAVAAYQRNAGLPVTGQVGPETWRRLTGIELAAA